METTRPPVAEEPPAILSGDALLDEALASPHFQRAPALSRLLTYLWERRSSLPTEYAVGVDVFGKTADFDPKIDATIRVHISRLRQKLRDYSLTLPPDRIARITLPTGSLKLQVDNLEPPVPLPTPPLSLPEPVDTRYRTLAIILGLVTVTLLMALTALLIKARSTELSARRDSAAELPAFWKRVLGNGKLTRIIFPTPVFLSTGPLRMRDVTVNDPGDVGSSSELKRLGLLTGKPRLSYSYSVTSDTLALATLLPVLSNGGLPITVNSTRNFPVEGYGRDNLLFLGIPPTSQHVARLLAGNRFYIEPGNSTLTIRDPSEAERRLNLNPPPDSAKRYGILAGTPGETPGARMVLLCGSHSDAVAAYLPSSLTLSQLETFLASKGHPEYFEMLIEADQEGPNLISARPAALSRDLSKALILLRNRVVAYPMLLALTA